MKCQLIRHRWYDAASRVACITIDYFFRHHLEGVYASQFKISDVRIMPFIVYFILKLGGQRGGGYQS